MNVWERQLFQGIGLSRISQVIPQIPDVSPSPVKGVLLGTMLPSLHYLAIVATLDEALTEYIEVNNVPWPNNTKRDLFNRINVVSRVVPTIDDIALQAIRKRRNRIAHEPDLILSDPVSWNELEEAIDHIYSSMRDLGLISEIPQIVAFYQRVPELFSNELGPQGERIRHQFTVGAKLNDDVFLEFSHDVLYFPPSPL
jgi:hypothetical protein